MYGSIFIKCSYLLPLHPLDNMVMASLSAYCHSKLKRPTSFHLCSPVKVSWLQTQRGRGFDIRRGWQASRCVRERGADGARARAGVRVCVWARIRKFMPSEDNYVTLSLNNLRGSVHPRKIFLIDRLSASLYIRRREGGVSHCCAWSPPECGCSAPKWTLRFCTHEVSRRYHFI